MTPFARKGLVYRRLQKDTKAVMDILLVGYHPSAARLLSRPVAAVECNVYLIEEPSLFRENMHFLHTPSEGLGGVVAVRLARYQQSDEYRDIATKWHAEIGFDAVMPGREYGVKAANDLSGLLGLPHATASAVEACTDKISLREMCARAGIAQPKFREVFGPSDVREFMKSVSGPVILKPANRHASLGVTAVENTDDVERAWRHAVNDEGSTAAGDRQLRWRYIAEEKVAGPQVSMETLVQNGHIIFNNVSLMEFDDEFRETGNLVPAPLNRDLAGELDRGNARFLEAIGANLGLFHSEWKLSDDGPRLLECAARLPGILRPEQIWWAWGFNLPLAFAQVLAGSDLDPFPPALADTGCRVGSFYPPDEGSYEIEGAELLAEIPQIVDYEITAYSSDAGRAARPFAVRYVAVDRSGERLDMIRTILDSHVHVRPGGYKNSANA